MRLQQPNAVIESLNNSAALRRRGMEAQEAVKANCKSLSSFRPPAALAQQFVLEQR